MSIVYKRPNSPFWYVAKTRQSTKTTNRKLAEEFARKSLSELWREHVLGETRYSWQTIASEWLAAKADMQSYERDRVICKDMTEWLSRRDIIDPPLSALTSDMVERYGAYVKARASAGTANRHLACIRAILRKAAAQNKIVKAPTITMYQITRTEARWLTIAEFNKLAAELPEMIRDMAIIAVQTGMRYSNVAGLRWSWLTQNDAVAVVPATNTKTRRTYTVPLSTIAKEVIARRRRAAIEGSVYVFQDGEAEVPLERVRNHWQKARIKAGIMCRFHDLRHTWASWHVQNGTPDRILMHMGGWSSPVMLGRYAHLATKHLENYADNAIQK